VTKPANHRRVALVVPDLLFSTRIEATAAQTGVAVTSLPADEAFAACAAEPPDLLVIDLTGPGDPVALAGALRQAEATRGIPIVAFYPHVDQALRERAVAAGIPQVLPRSAFVARMAEILRGT
jgi:CheY-like chemotaxis protein